MCCSPPSLTPISVTVCEGFSCFIITITAEIDLRFRCSTLGWVSVSMSSFNDHLFSFLQYIWAQKRSNVPHLFSCSVPTAAPEILGFFFFNWNRERSQEFSADFVWMCSARIHLPSTLNKKTFLCENLKCLGKLLTETLFPGCVFVTQAVWGRKNMCVLIPDESQRRGFMMEIGSEMAVQGALCCR